MPILNIPALLLMAFTLLLSACGGGGVGGGFDITLPDAPVIEAQGVYPKPKSAVVAMAINPNGDNTEYWFEWGADASLGNKTQQVSLGDGNASLPVVWDSAQQSITLSPDTTYYYRVVAKTKLHTVVGEILSFTTPPVPPPTATTKAATTVTSNSCNLVGTVNPQGFATSAWFEWGVDIQYGNTTPQQSLGDSAQGIPYNQPLEKLSPKTTYHYRSVAQNEGGMVTGADASCTTDSSIVLGSGGSPADADGDGLSDSDEVDLYGTNPLMADTDGDGLNDGDEVKTHNTDPRKSDSDGDGLTDGDELSAYHTDPLVLDSDGDGLSDGSEAKVSYTDPLAADSDGDSLSDGDEVNTHHSDPLRMDTDIDGLSDGDEVNVYHTDPVKQDSDADGLTDSAELYIHTTDPLKADSDGDGLLDGAEVGTHGTDPLKADSDGDGLSDSAEINSYSTDPLKPDTDGDGLSDSAEVNTHKTDPLTADTDGDGLSDSAELNVYSTDPLKGDTDSDGLSDSAELTTYFTDPLKADGDGDGLLDGEEVNVHHTDPAKADTDGDGLTDGAEVNVHGSDPLKADSDLDTLSDGAEINVHKTDPTRQDTDGDGLLDGDEVNIHHTNPTKADTDGDGLIDAQEINSYGTNPLTGDSDGEGLTDGQEILTYLTNPLKSDTDADTLDDYQEVTVYHTDPNNPDSDGDGISDGNEVRLGKNPLVADSVTYYPDLVMTAVIGARGGVAGQQVSVTVTVRNSGPLDVTAAFEVGIYLSQDSSIGGDDTYIGSWRSSAGLLAGADDTGTVTVTIPVAMPEGVYYLGAVADAAGEMLEGDETNNAGIASSTISVAAGFDGGDGSDGAAILAGGFNLMTDSSDALGNVSDGNGSQPDGFAASLSSDAQGSSTVLTVSSTAGFVTGDEVLILQVFHDTNHGVYEFKKNVTVLNATTLELGTGLNHGYYATGTNAQGTANIAQVIRVPNYSALDVPVGVILTTGAFDVAARVGGVIAVRAGTVTVDGAIRADALGLVGGPAAVSGSNAAYVYGTQGWSYTGQGSYNVRSANAGGGGGAVGSYGGGGGGGGYGAAGSGGINANSGLGGGAYGDAQLTRIYLGSGGGSGAALTATSGKGGSGGGIVYVGADTLNVAGTISSNGEKGGNASAAGTRGGGGGGGSGGSVYLAASSANLTGSMTASGGNGGAAGGSACCKTGGAAGGAGRIMQLQPSPPDLVVSDVSGPVSATRGSTVTISSTVANPLNVSTGPFSVGIYLSGDALINSSDILLGTRLVTGLAGGDSDTALTTGTIPAVLPGIDYVRRKALTINGAKVAGSAPLANFPVLVDITDPSLKTVANGGEVQSNGNDIVFYDAAGLGGGNRLDFEIEQYNGVAGHLLAWVRIPTLTPGVNTQFYVYYGSSSMSISPATPAAVWDSGFQGVYHLSQAPGGAGSLSDSTANARDGTPQGSPLTTAGGVGNAVYFDGIDDYFITPSLLDPALNDYTLETWVKKNVNDVQYVLMQTQDGGGQMGRTQMFIQYDNYLSSFHIDTAYSSGFATTTANWCYVALVKTGSVLSWFVNGTLVGTNTGVSVEPNTQPWQFGVSKNLTSYLSGIMDEVRVSSVQRSAGWIATEYNAMSSPATFISVGAAEVVPLPPLDLYFGAIADINHTVVELNENNNVQAQLTAAGTAQSSAVSFTFSSRGGGPASGGGGSLALVWLLLGWGAARKIPWA